MLQLMAAFGAQGWQLHFASAAQKSEHAADLEALIVSTHVIRLNDSSFNDFVVELAPDVVLYDRFMTEEQYSWRVAQTCPQALQVLDTEDLHCLRHARHVALKKGEELKLEDLNSDIARREVASIWRCDLSLMISSYEMELLRAHFGVSSSLLLHLPFLLDPVSEAAQAAWKPYEQRAHFVTIGNFLHAPNLDGVKYLKQTIWPLIRQRMPEAEMRVYGAYVPEQAQQWNNPREGFHVLGRADDAHEVIGNARVLLAPLRFGAGLKGKLIDAMQSGTPSVTTCIGAEAMSGDLPWPGAVANDPEDFADAAVAIYQDKGKWLKAQQSGIHVLNDFYNRETHSRCLVEAVLSLSVNLDKHRAANFTGSMLRYHTMRSTEFMSRWIELKNTKREER